VACPHVRYIFKGFVWQCRFTHTHWRLQSVLLRAYQVQAFDAVIRR
jgi:hypothetical protein